MSAPDVRGFFLQSIVDNIGVILALLACFLLLKLIKSGRPDNVPPGPYPWPILGNIWQLSRDPRQSLPVLKQKYGDIISMNFANQLAVFLNSYDVIKEAFSADSFLGRPQNQFFMVAIGNLKGIASSSGHLWKEQRKFSLHLLRKFGLGRQDFEQRMLEEVRAFLDVIRKRDGQPIDVCPLLHASMSNIIFSITFGRRFEHSDPNFCACLDRVHDIFRDAGNTAISNLVPWINYLPGDLSKEKACLKNKAEVEKFLDKLLLDVKISYDCEEEPQNFVESYLQKIEDEKQDFNSSFNESQLTQIIFDLFVSGTDTTASTIRWAVLHLMKNPTMQVKMQREIDGVTGGHRHPNMGDLPALPFTEAFINEVQRFSYIAPLGGPRATTEDTYLRGYFIPKDTWVFSNLHIVFHDKAFWGDPEVFRPGRFLDEKGKLIKHDRFIPFSFGKRDCFGESLAKAEMFLFVSGIVDSFTIRLPQGAAFPDMEGQLGCTVTAAAFEICADTRDKAPKI